MFVKLKCGGYAKITKQKNEEKSHPTNNYLFKVFIRNTRKRHEMCSKLTIMILEQCK